MERNEETLRYLTSKETAAQWKISERRIIELCNNGRIDGAKKFGWSWAIPQDSVKPADLRYKSVQTSLFDEDFLEEEYKNILSITEPLIERKWAMPNHNTFSIKPIKELIASEMNAGLWIDPFANTNKLATITNDLNPEYDTDYHLDALDFLKLFEDNSVDGILYDPPFSPRQVSECYKNVGYNVTWDTTKASFWANHKKEISRILKKGGKVITFGWNSGGIGMTNGFKIKRILLVPHGGWHNDTICTVEVKIREGMSKSKKSSIVKEQIALDSIAPTKTNDTDRQIISWIESLPENFWDFKNEDTAEFTHSFHNYPATMIYPISRNIIKKMQELQKIDSLLDPFSGSGTVLVEALLAGINTIYANDLNPLAMLLTKVKTTLIPEDKLKSFKDRLIKNISSEKERCKVLTINIDDYISANDIDITSRNGWGTDAPDILKNYISQYGIDFEIPSFNNIGYWFKPRVIINLQTIFTQINSETDTDLRDFALVAFSETLRLASNRRNGEFKMYRMPKNKVLDFEPNAFEIFEGILNNNIDKMNDMSAVISSNNSKLCFSQEDTRNLYAVPDNSVDLIITSPPYGDSRTTVAYGEFSRLSLQWIGLNHEISIEPNQIDKSLMGGEKYRNGFEYILSSKTLKEALEKISLKDIERAGDVYSFYEDLDECLQNLSKKSKKYSYQYWVVGNRTIKGIYLDTDIILTELAAEYGLHHVLTFTRNIHNKVMPSKNSPSNKAGITSSTMLNEFIVVLRKA